VVCREFVLVAAFRVAQHWGRLVRCAMPRGAHHVVDLDCVTMSSFTIHLHLTIGLCKHVWDLLVYVRTCSGLLILVFFLSCKEQWYWQGHDRAAACIDLLHLMLFCMLLGLHLGYQCWCQLTSSSSLCSLCIIQEPH